MPDSAAIRAGNAYVQISAKESLARGLAKAQSKLDAFASKAQSAFVTSAAVAAPFGVATKTFSDFDDQMRLVQGVTGATGEQFDSLVAKAQELGRTTSWTASQVAEGMTSLGRAGFKSDEINASIGSVMDLARATGTEIGPATDIAGNALRAFGLDASQMERVCDVLATTANGSAQTLEDLGEAFKYVAPIAASSGESLEDTAKTVGALANFGVKGSQAGTVIKAIETRMASNAGAQATYAELGIDTRDAEGNLRKVSDVLADLGKAIGDMPTGEKLEKIKSVFGQYGLAAVSLTSSSFEDLNKAIDESEGSARRTAETMDDGLGGSVRIAKSAVEGLAIAFGTTVAPTVQKFAESIQNAAGALTRFTNAHPALITALTKFGGGLLTVQGALLIGAKTISMMISSYRMLASGISGVFNVVGKLAGLFTGASTAASANAVAAGSAATANAALATSETQVAVASNASAAAQMRTAAAANSARAATLARVAAIAGIAVAVAGAVAALEYYCGAEARASKAAAKASAAAAERVRSNEEEAEQSKQLFARLEELGSKAELTNAEFEEGKIIADQLQKTYGDLGIVIDENAKKFGNLTVAANNFNEAIAAQSVKDKEFQLRQEQAEAEALRHEYDSYMNKSVKGWWKEFKGVFSGEGVAERAGDIQARLREIQHNRQKLQNEIDLTKAQHKSLQDQSFFDRRQARADMQQYREATRPPFEPPKDVAVTYVPKISADSLPAIEMPGGDAALDELAKQTEESRRQTETLRQIMNNTAPDDSDYI